MARNSSVRTLASVLLLSFATACTGQQAAVTSTQTYDALHPAPDAPIPDAQQLREQLQKLTTTCRVMEVVAHPDDEDGPLLTELARGRGCQVILFTLTRGEGGQNASGAIFGDELGLLRTMELLAADRVYGADERFSRVADFGFSKTPEESLAKWGGKDVPLGDLVRQIRLFRPDVLIARFSGTPRDGHGHHQASSLLTQEAFHAAADPKRCPEQGLLPWQAAKLYIGNIPEDETTLTIDNGKIDPLLGEAPARIALGGLRHQASQGLGAVDYNPARAVTRLKLIATADGIARAEHETDIFQGIDISPESIHARAPEVPESSIASFDAAVQRALSADVAATKISAIAEAVKAAHIAERCRFNPGKNPVEQARGKQDAELKLRQASEALELASGVALSAQAAGGTPALVAAGYRLPIGVRLADDTRTPVRVTDCYLSQAGVSHREPCTLPTNTTPAATTMEYTMQPGDIARAPFHRTDKLSGTVYLLDNPAALDRPLPAGSVSITAEVTIAGAPIEITTQVRSPELRSDIFLAPAITLETSPDAYLRNSHDSSEVQQDIIASTHAQQTTAATGTIDAPPGWVLTPRSAALSLPPAGKDREQFLVMPAPQPADSHITVPAHATADGATHRESVHLIQRADLDAFPFYFPAQTQWSFLKVEFPAGLRVGYIIGAGDNIPEALRSLGVDVTLLTPDDLAHGDLSRYATIVTGIRAYATRADLRENNGRLLDWVRAGGTMVVQYEQDFGGFNAGRFAPYPLTLGNIRADQEELPVTVLDPQDTVFHAPNTVTGADFNDWIQERGLYFAKEWSPEYTPLLGMADAGEPERRGALLRAHVGKGTWIYSGLAMFRQVPNGVPGATRLFLNMLAAGHTANEAPIVQAQSKAAR